MNLRGKIEIKLQYYNIKYEMKPLALIVIMLGIAQCVVTPSPLRNMYFPEYETLPTISNQASADLLTNFTIGGYQCIRAGMAYAVV